MKKEYNIAIIAGVFGIITAVVGGIDWTGPNPPGPFIYDTPSLIEVEGIDGPDECSDRSKWCHKFIKIEMMETKQDNSQINLRINLQVKDDFGSEQKGQVYVSMTVVPSNSEKQYDSKLVDTTKSEPAKVPFDVYLSTKDHYSLLFELISTQDSDSPHIFHNYTIDFDFP